MEPAARHAASARTQQGQVVARREHAQVLPRVVLHRQALLPSRTLRRTTRSGWRPRTLRHSTRQRHNASAAWMLRARPHSLRQVQRIHTAPGQRLLPSAPQREDDIHQRDIRRTALPVLPRAAKQSAVGTHILLLRTAQHHRHVHYRPVSGHRRVRSHHNRLHTGQGGGIQRYGVGVLRPAQQRPMAEVVPLPACNGGRVSVSYSNAARLLRTVRTNDTRQHRHSARHIQIAGALQVISHLFQKRRPFSANFFVLLHT